MARTIKELTEGQVLYLNETTSGNTSFVPYIYLGLDESGNAIILRKYVVSTKRMNNINLGEYIGCEMDLYLNNQEGDLWTTTAKEATTHVDYRNNGFLTRFDEATRNCFVRTQLKHYVLAEQATVTIDRECFLLSYTHLGYATTPAEGKSFLPALAKATGQTGNNARICRTTSETAVNCWVSSECSAGSFRYIGTNGSANNYSATNTYNYFRPALSVAADTIVSEETEETIYLLPDGSNPYRELDVVIDMGKRQDVPNNIICSFECENCDELDVYATVNLNDESPVWFKVENDVQIDTSEMVAENGCNLGLKVYAKSNGRAVLHEPVIICE